jgi:hypothetical protein
MISSSALRSKPTHPRLHPNRHREIDPAIDEAGLTAKRYTSSPVANEKSNRPVVGTHPSPCPLRLAPNHVLGLPFHEGWKARPARSGAT